MQNFLSVSLLLCLGTFLKDFVHLDLLRFPSDFVPLMCQGLKNTVEREHHAVFKELEERKIPYLIGFQGSFGSHRVTPRTLKANLLGKLVSVDGILIKLSPRLLSQTKEAKTGLTPKYGKEEEEQDEGSFVLNKQLVYRCIISVL